MTLANARLKASVRFPPLRGMYEKGALARDATYPLGLFRELLAPIVFFLEALTLGLTIGLVGTLEAKRVVGLLNWKAGGNFGSSTESGWGGMSSFSLDSPSSELLLGLEQSLSSSSSFEELSELLIGSSTSLFLRRSAFLCLVFAIRMFICSKMDIGVPQFLCVWLQVTNSGVD